MTATPEPNTDILYAVTDGIGRVTFNRPAQRNALTFGMYERLADICRTVPTEGARAVKALIVTGQGEKAFAAGTDISLFRGFTKPEQGIAYEVAANEHFSGIETCAVPTIAAISGACTGGGAAIAACCDMRIATRDMKFGFPIARTLGNCLAVASLARLVALVGEARVIDMIYTSRLIGAEEALQIGLISEIVDDHPALVRRVDELARTIAGNAPLTIRATKQLLHRLRHQGAAADDRDIVGQVYSSADFREGLDAFLSKRAPHWTGK
jgi:enoyl-CoA hydratase